MITIEYDFENHDVTVDGHAGGGPNGEDIYCAGISALVMALCSSLICAKEQGIIKKNGLTWELREGHSHIQALPKKGWEPIIEAIFSTVFHGFEMMATSFPDYVSFKQRGVENT